MWRTDSRIFHTSALIVDEQNVGLGEQRCIHPAVGGVVVDDATGLQMGKDGDGTKIFEAPLFQVSAEAIRQGVLCFPAALMVLWVDVGRSLCKGSDIAVKAAPF